MDKLSMFEILKLQCLFIVIERFKKKKIVYLLNNLLSDVSHL